MSRLHYTPTLTLEDRAMCVLEVLNAAGVQLYFDESMPGPVLKIAGELRALDDWTEWDHLWERKFIVVDEDSQTAGPTWEGIKALRKWQRKYKR
jgi:hypothetical protein